MSVARTTSAAADRARAVHDPMRQHQREVASVRHKHERRKNVRLALASVVILAGVLAFGFYSGLPTLLLSAPRTAKPVDPFVATGVGQIRIPHKNDVCRELRFDNKTGAVSGEAYVPCGSAAVRPGGSSSPEGRTRLEAISDAFRR